MPGTEPLDVLTKRAQRNDRGALDDLVRALQDPIYRLAVRFLGNPDHARDATQEILLLVVSDLANFRGESSVKTWAYRIASRQLIRQKRRGRKWTFESLAEDDIGQRPNAIEPETLARADEKLLEEEIFIGCTQAMLQALDKSHRLAFVLGAICELDGADAASVLGISEAAFRKRLSRARAMLDAFVAKHCGVASPTNACRCVYQVNLNVARRCVDAARLDYAVASTKASVEVLRALGAVREVRRALELYRAQPDFKAPEDFAVRIRAVIASASALAVS